MESLDRAKTFLEGEGRLRLSTADAELMHGPSYPPEMGWWRFQYAFQPQRYENVTGTIDYRLHDVVFDPATGWLESTYAEKGSFPAG